MILEYALNAEDVREMMLNTMESHLSLKTEGYRCTTEQTINLLLKAVAEGSSVEAVCADTCAGVDTNNAARAVERRVSRRDSSGDAMRRFGNRSRYPAYPTISNAGTRKTIRFQTMCGYFDLLCS